MKIFFFTNCKKNIAQGIFLQIVKIFERCAYTYFVVIREKACHVISDVLFMYFTFQISTDRIAKEVICYLV